MKYAYHLGNFGPQEQATAICRKAPKNYKPAGKAKIPVDSRGNIVAPTKKSINVFYRIRLDPEKIYDIFTLEELKTTMLYKLDHCIEKQNVLMTLLPKVYK